MFDLADNDKLKFTATSEDSRGLDTLAHAQRQETLGAYLVEVGLAEPGESAEFDAKSFPRQLEDKLRGAAAVADAGYPENDGLVIDPETGARR